MHLSRKPSLAALCLVSLIGAPFAYAQLPGDILWIVEADSYSQGPRPSVAADGTIYWNPTGTLYALTPDGQPLWNASPSGGLTGGRVAIGADGTLYTASHMAVTARSPIDGTLLWSFDQLGVAPGIIGGPDVGPDGNIYVVADGGIGMFSLTPAGNLRWNMTGWGNNGGSPGSEIVFNHEYLFKAENIAPIIGQGLMAVRFDGQIAWSIAMTVGSGDATRSPRISPFNGNLHVGVSLNAAVRTSSSQGDWLWMHVAPGNASSTFGPAVGPDGVVYYVTEFKSLFAVNPDGSEKWVSPSVIPYAVWPNVPEVSPQGDVVVFGSDACFGAACPGRVAAVNAADGAVRWVIALPNLNGQVMAVRGRPRFSPDGSVVYLTVQAFAANDNKAYLFAIAVAPTTQVAGDITGDGVVNINDLLAVIGAWGQCAAPCPPACDADISPPEGDCQVDINDLLMVISSWG